MRTTIDIDEDVLLAAKELASRRKSTAGKVISELARRGLLGRSVEHPQSARNGFKLLPPGGQTVTPKLIDELLEDDVT
ncbi:MAG: antitoxin [Gammaproteobacteria bacterium]